MFCVLRAGTSRDSLPLLSSRASGGDSVTLLSSPRIAYQQRQVEAGRQLALRRVVNLWTDGAAAVAAIDRGVHVGWMARAGDDTSSTPSPNNGARLPLQLPVVFSPE